MSDSDDSALKANHPPLTFSLAEAQQPAKARALAEKAKSTEEKVDSDPTEKMTEPLRTLAAALYLHPLTSFFYWTASVEYSDKSKQEAIQIQKRVIRGRWYMLSVAFDFVFEVALMILFIWGTFCVVSKLLS